MDALIEFTATRWRCPVCRRSYARRGTALNHQAICHRDPANRSCRTCVHDPLKGKYLYDGHDCDAGGEPLDQYSGKWVLHCPLWEQS